MDYLMDRPYPELMDFIRLKFAGTDQYERNLKAEVTRYLTGPVTANYKTKTLICRMSAMLDENYISNSAELETAVTQRLFGDVFDVEHIQSYQDKNVAEREAILAAWGGEINAIGNLVAIESSINRSMRNDEYADKRLAYQSSLFPSVAKILVDYPTLGLDFAVARKGLEIEKIINYIFENVE
ncbi:MAG: HNH endonuclease [Bacteroidetes bacterium]|nr:HNH endonuclease [Bacteroidota bacterium]